MEKYKNIGYFLLFVTAFSVNPILVVAEVKSVSACHGSGSETCNYITLECDPGSRIRLLNMKYGVKTYNCNSSSRRERCLDSSRNGCCVQSNDDCMEYYSDLHAYNLHTECSGRQSCGPLPVPINILRSCDGDPSSSYVHVTYECQAVSDDVAVSLCRENNLKNLNGEDISIFFNNTVNVFSKSSNCSCFISSSGKISLEYVDVRMTKSRTNTEGSDCSSSILTTIPDDSIITGCDNGLNEEDNFVYGELEETNVKNIEVKLLNIYKNGISDAPEFIWLNVNAEDQKSVNVQCFKHVDHSPTTMTPSLTTSESTSNIPNNTTGAKITDGDDSNTGAIVAGVLVPIILLAVVGAVVAFLVLKRRGNLKRAKQPHAPPNRYTDNTAIENSLENSEYAEIGFVPSEPQTEPPYDPVYVPKNKKADLDSCNGHAYQNVGNTNREEEKANKPKWPFGNIKSHTDRLISFFRNQHENDFGQVKKRDKDVSDGSYDHLRPTSANSEVHVEVTPPSSSEPNHTYSHTSDESVKRLVAADKEKSRNNKSGELATKKHPDMTGQDLNAVHVGDSYIEFKFGAMDKNHPNLVKMDETEKSRPVPPSRPPPSPRSVAKMKKEHSPSSSPKVTHKNLNEEKDTRSKTPNFLSPGDRKHEASTTDYDYAAGADVPLHSASPRTSDVSDVSSEHSYKILDPQPVYDYADVSDSEIADGTYQSGSVYEDVNKDPRSASERKHKSAAEIPQDQNGYLEPVTSRTGVISSPIVNLYSNDKAKIPETQTPNTNMLANELKEITKQKNRDNPINKAEMKTNTNAAAPKKQKVGSKNEAVKSDNIDTKDYQKVDGTKGVLKMAKMFESKDSDSGNSRQNSPRDIKITNSPELKKNVDRTSSNV